MTQPTSTIAKISSAATLAGGATLAFLCSVRGAVGLAVLAAVVAGAVAGPIVARPRLGYGIGATVAALAALAGGYLVVGLIAAAYALMVGRSIWLHQAARLATVA